VKADLKRELEDFSLNCSKCGLDVHRVSGLGVTPDTQRMGSLRRTVNLPFKSCSRGRGEFAGDLMS
jgi:hypothetical protein